jgi:glycosyltransferase involved in cell wall biosynthesis
MSITQAFMSTDQYQTIVERDQALDKLHRLEEGVTVCIPCYNVELGQLQRALDSALRQTVMPVEVILVDDGSLEPVNCLSTITPVKIVRTNNRGLPSARNTGLMNTRSLAFLPLDADDWLEETYIEKTLPLLQDADVVLTGLQEHGPTRNGTYMPGYDRPYNEVDEEVLWGYNRYFYCSLFRTQILRDCGGYHPAMAGWPGVHGGYEDWDLWIDLMRRGTRFAAVNEVLFHYSTNPEGMLARAESNRGQLVAEMRRHHA